jgi:hypothetical protein
MFHCTVCNKNVSCWHQGEADVARHSATAQHTSMAKTLKQNSTLTFKPVNSNFTDKEIDI